MKQEMSNSTANGVFMQLPKEYSCDDVDPEKVDMQREIVKIEKKLQDARSELYVMVEKFMYVLAEKDKEIAALASKYQSRINHNEDVKGFDTLATKRGKRFKM